MIPYSGTSMKMVPQAYQETAINLSVWIYFTGSFNQKQ